jgi:hypothetical protein
MIGGTAENERLSMNVPSARIMFLAPVLALATCSGGEQAKQPLTLHEVMKDQIDANADKLWDLTNPALGDQAQLIPSKISDEQWAQIEDRANKVKAGADTLVTMYPIIVAKEGVKIADEDVPYGDSAASVQANIDKDADKLREFAGVLAQHMADLAAAAKAHDAARAGPLIDQLDSVCEDCHLEFWYPDQKELVQKFREASAVAPPK